MEHRPYSTATIFAISMGFFESAVVVYLRKIAYPDGFAFPLQPLDGTIALTELIREVFSMLMLLTVAQLISRNRNERLAWFIYNFAVWDISYYVFLKLLLGWPASLFTMDILFLIPFIWTGPVIAPILLSGLMIWLAVLILKYNKPLKRVKIVALELWSFIAGSVIVIFSFTLDYLNYFFKHGGTVWQLFCMRLHTKLSVDYIPQKFYWLIFGLGFLVLSFGILKFYLRNRIYRGTR